MSAPAPYGLAQARRSLAGFARWKLVSAVLGLLLLVSLARLAPAEEYGVYVALLALVEMFYLVSGLGLSVIPQRYLPEYRLHASAAQFDALMRRLVGRRLLQSLLGVAVLAVAWWQVPDLLGVPLPPSSAAWLALWLVAGCQARLMDEVFPALLLQGYTQGLQALANALRLLGLVLAVSLTPGVDHRWLLAMEALLALGLSLTAWALLRRYRRRQAWAASTDFVEPDPRALAWQMYWAQLAAQLWSGNAIKLLLLRVAGPQATALYGFCQALVDLLRNYSPAFLLGNWVRPLMVARYLAARRIEPVASLSGLVLKLSVLGLLPFLAWFAAQGETLAALVSGGRYREGAAALLAAMALVAMLFCARAVLSMVSVTVERLRVQLVATAAAALALPAAWLAHQQLGLIAVPLVLAAAELLWSIWVARDLRRDGLALRWAWRGWWRCALIALVVLLGAQGAAVLLRELPALLALGAGLSAALLLTVLGAWLLPPLEPAERADLDDFLPGRRRPTSA